MVTGAVLALTAVLTAAGAGDQPGAAPQNGPAEAVRASLAKGDYPWYDAAADSAKPILDSDPDPDSNIKIPAFAAIGEVLGFVIAAIALGVLVYLIVVLWMRYRTAPGASSEIVVGRAGSGHRVEALPAGLRPDTDDPWAEALRLRSIGDYAGAVIRLFAHQLLTLDRLRQIRLGPGRTGRQLIRAVDDPQLHAWTEPTLRMFEAVYYGHSVPTVEAFERVWALAEAFENHVALRTTS